MAHDPGDLVMTAVREVLGARLDAFVHYGSSVTGDLLPGYSDLDVLIGLNEPITLADTLALQHAIEVIALEPFGYCQPTFVLGDPARPLLTPGAFQVLSGAISQERWVCGADDLRSRGEAWLVDLSRLVASDAGDWAMTTRARLRRQARLHLTRVKPSLRALLVRAGCEPVRAWAGTWQQIATWLRPVDHTLGDQVDRLLAEARARRDRPVAETALRVLSRVCTEHLHEDGSGGYLKLSPPDRCSHG